MINQRKKAQEIIGGVLRRVPISPMGELKLPKELLQQLQFNIEKTRDAVLGIVSQEVSRMASNMDTQRVLEQILRNNRIKISAEITFEPKQKKRGKRNG